VLLDGVEEVRFDLVGEGPLFWGKLVSWVLNVEELSVVLVLGEVFPEGSGVVHKLFLELQVPVFVFPVEVELFLLGHVVDGDEAVVSLGVEVGPGGNGEWWSLFKVVHFMDCLVVSQDSVWLVDED